MTEEVILHGFRFSGRAGEVSAERPDQVVPALELLERRVAQGCHAAGFISYEAAGALNGDLTTCAPGELPLLWFGLFQERREEEKSPPVPLCKGGSGIGSQPAAAPEFQSWDWRASVGEEEHARQISAIRELIAAGDCYQVNLTLRQRFSYTGAPRAWFSELCSSQPTPYNCYLEAGHFRILSASPELFFSIADRTLTTRPMKGTAARGRWFQEDREARRRLTQSPKELAENLMIVDLLRNDMGIVSETGSVQVESLFDVETHPTVHQMTSTISSRLREGVRTLDVLRALFPCGSVTGAPKRRSMEIIAELEREPRGVYTGALGYLAPGGEALFSVAIRTLVLDSRSGSGELGIGSGITFDSTAGAEYAESLAKSRFARERAPEFHLIESLLHDGSYFLLERHLGRLARSAAYFGFPLRPEAAREALERQAALLTQPAKVRLLLFRDGSLSCESVPLGEPPMTGSVALAGVTVNSADPFLYHKTSRRGIYNEAVARRPELTDVIFVNQRGELTEAANSNLVLEMDGKLLTPPLESGLLPGVFREELLARGEIEERVLTPADLAAADRVFLINSVRKWREVRLVNQSSHT